MKFTIANKSLLRPLTDIDSIVAKKTTKPILSHLLLIISDNAMTIKGTDTEVTLQIDLDNLEVKQSGSITIPATKFLDVIRKLPEGAMVSCHLENEQFIIKSVGSTFRLATLPAEDFPALDESDTQTRIEISGRQLHDIMQQVKFSMATDDVRYYLNGLFLNIIENGNAVHAVTTDGHRLSCAKTLLEGKTDINTSLIVPKKGVTELIRLLNRYNQPVVLNIGDRQLNLTIDNYKLTTQLIDGTFPNYEQVLPPIQDDPILVSRTSLLQSLKRGKILLSDRHDGIRLRFYGNQLLLSARNLENETSEEILDVINTSSLELETGLNINYLIEAISALNDDNIQFHFEDATSPCLIMGSGNFDVRYIIMPMRL